jgi:hypothetical protein
MVLPNIYNSAETEKSGAELDETGAEKKWRNWLQPSNCSINFQATCDHRFIIPTIDVVVIESFDGCAGHGAGCA